MRRRLRAFSFFALAVVAITCTDAPTSPKVSGRPELVPGRLVMTPSFSEEAARTYRALAAFGIEVTDVHIRLTAADGSTRDTVIAFPASQATLTIEIPVLVSGSDQSFTALIELRNDQGVVLFSGTQVVVARALHLPPLTPPPVIIQYTGPGRGTRTVSVTPLDATVSGAATRAFTASAVDSSGRPITDLLVRWETSDASLATVTSTGNATATVNVAGRRGSATITATTPQGVAGTSRLTITPLPARVVVVSGGAQSGVAGSVLAQPLIVEVQAADNLPAPGATVNFRAITAGGAVQRASAVTDATGRATSTLTVGTLAGLYQFEAASGSLAPVTVTETATPSTPAQLSIVSGDAQVDSVGRSLPLPLVVRVSDQFGNGVGGATVIWTRESGTGSLGASGTTTSADGLASTTYTLGSLVGSESVRATATAVAGPTGTALFAMRATNRSASAIAIIAGGSQTGAANLTLPSPLVARVTDALGNAVPNVAVSWGASLGGATFAPPSSTTAANGQAATTVTLGATAGVITVTATTGALVAATSMTIVAGPGATLTKNAGDGQSAPVGTTVAIAPSVLLKNAAGNPAVDAAVTFAVAGGGGTATGVNTTTNAAGIATVGSWTLGGAAGANTLTATAGELSTTFTATGVSVGATKLALVQPAPATITVGVPFPAPVLVQLLDGANNPVAQAGVVITATGLVQPANTSFQLTATSNAAGLATFAVQPYVGSTGTLVFTLTGIGITTLTVSPITILTGAATKLVIVTQPPTTAVNGVALAPQPGVQITDDGLNPVNLSGVNIAASIVTGGGSLGGTRSATTNGSGQATFANLSITGTPGSRTLQFSSGEFVQATSTAINVGAGSAVSIQKNTGDLQSATAGTPVAVAPSVTLSDVGGNPVAGVAVVFAVASGGGSATTLNATTNALGIATVGSWTLGGTAGANTLTASSGALSVTFSATGTAGSASKFALVQPLPANISVGGAIAPISVRLIDATNNPVPQAGVLVTATDVSLPGNTTVAVSATTDAAGIATFTLPPYVGAIGSATLTFSAPGISSLTPASLPIVTGPAAKLLLTTQPGASATAGAPLSPQPVVQITDVGDNPVSSAGVSIVASIFSGGGTVGGTTTINTIASGQAAFTNLAITGAFGPRVLDFSAATLTSVRSNVVTVGAGAAANIAINAGAGQTATVDAPVAVVPSVKVTDASGNPVAGVAVAFTPRSGGQIGGLRSVVTVSTDASGIATVSGWGLGTKAGPNSDSLDVSSAGLAGSPILFVASATAGPATRWIMSTQPPALSPNGATLTPAPAVRLTDGFLNPVSLGGQTATATIGSGGGTLGGVTTVTTDAAGVATFGNLTITGTSGIRTLLFSDGVRTAVTSNPVNVTAGGASALLITTQPATSVPAGSPLSPQPIIQLVDAGSNAVSLAGVAVTASIASGGGTLGGTTTVVTAASGSASFTDLSIGGIVGSRTLLFTSGALAGATSGSIAVNAGATRNLGVNSGNLQSAAVGTAVALPPSVKITDPFNNPVGGVAVTFAVSTPGATVSNGISTGTSVIVTTNAAGIAALTSWTLGTTAGSYSMDATAAVATGSPQTFTATAISGLATQLAFITAPSSAATNAIAFSAQPVLQLRDAQNNPVSASGVVITMGITSGVGSLSNFTAITNASGIATFSGLSITGLAGAFNIEFVTGAITLPFGPIALSAGVATQLMIGANPSSSAQVGVPFVTQPVIRLGDVSGNLVSQSGVNVTAVIASGSGALTGVASVSTNASGVAGFTNLAISGSIGSFLLRFTNGPLSSVLSAAINVTAGPGVQLAVAAPPSVTATSGTALTQQPVIQIQDSGGNSAVTAGVVVTATITSGSGSLLNSTATTIAGGTASFSGLTITGVSGPFVLQFGASGYSPVNSGLITVSGPSTLTTKVGTRVSSTVAGTTNPTIAPVFAAKSGAGAPLPGVNVSMTANGRCFLDVAGLLLTTQTKVTDVNGEVTPLVRLPAGADGAGCVIRATGPFTTQTDSALLAVYPSNATHIWVGGTSTSWSTAANWIGPSNAVVAAAPSSADQVFVPNYVGVVNAPRLATAVSVRRLALDTAAIVDANVTVLTIGNLGVTGFGIVINGTTNLITTASLNGVFDKLVIGQPASCGAASPMLATLAVVQATSLDIYCRAVVDTGLVSATDATVLPGGWLRIDSRGTVIVTNNATFGGDSLTVDGTLQVSGTAQLGGSRVGIYSSNNVTFNNATFSSTAGSFSNSTILVQGNAVFGGAGAGQQNFSGGTLAVFKNFTQLTGTVSGNTGLTFSTSSDHVTAFAGSTSQAVSFADPTTSKFSIVRITNAVTPVVFNSNVQFVNGTTQPRLEVQAGGLTVPNVLNLGGGTWKLFNGTTTTVTGSMVSAGACQGRAAGATLTGTGLVNAVPVTSFSCP